MNISRLFHTVWHLKLVQIYGRLWHYFYRPRVPSLTIPSIRFPDNCFTPSIEKRKSLVSPTKFRFLNQEHDIANASDWNDPSIDKLWLYNLHYFDYLNEKNDEQESEICRGVIERWINENPPFIGNGWEPYPLSLRIVNWIKWCLAGNEPAKEWTKSLYPQAWYLRRKLEIHLLGNHLFANAKALIFAGLFFEGREAEEWLKKGLQILAREVPEQILCDGGHFERSPMYHSIILEDLLDLINILKTYDQKPPPLWFDSIGKMLSWLKAMCHPDGQISFFNDAARGVASEPEKIEEYAGRLGVPASESPWEGITELEDSGYVRLQKGDVVLIVDVGKIGPDYLPGHAHADTLSFEFSLKDRRIFVNSGTSCYGNSMERLAQRGTSAHNTVMIDSRNSSEVWAGFRVARRARPLGRATIKHVDGQIICRAGHDGYKRLRGNVLHWRKIIFNKENIFIEDEIQGKGQHLAELFWQFHPEIDVRQSDDKWFLLHDELGKIGEMTIQGAEDIQLLSATYHPEFGLSLETKKLVAKTRGSLPIKFLTRISSFNSQ